MLSVPKTMRAVVYRGPNDLRLETLPVPRIGPGDLLVRVAACGVCPTDIKKIQYGTVPPPRVFGHETAGTVVRVGARARGFRPGDRVALHHHVPCLHCHACRHRAFAQCPQYKRTGITAGFEPAGGGYAEYVRVMSFVLPGVVKIPPRNSFLEGAMQEPVNTVLKAVNRLALQRGDTVLVAGQGPIGLLFTRLLALRGIHVIATDLLPPRLQLAKKWGARHVFRPDDPNFPTQVDRLTKGRGFDAAVLAVPADAAVRQALALVRGGGQVLLFAHTRRQNASCVGWGRPVPTTDVPDSALRTPHSEFDDSALRTPHSAFDLDLSAICVDEKDLIGSYSSDFTLQPEVARLVFSRRLDVRPLITHQFPLDQTAQAIALAARPQPGSLKVMVCVQDAGFLETNNLTGANRENRAKAGTQK